MKEIQDILSQAIHAPVLATINDRPVLALPPDWKHVDMEHLLPWPDRIRAKPTFINQTSFCEYVNRFKDADSWINLVASEKGAAATAFLDYHGQETGASWNTHCAIYNTKHSEAWKTWQAKNGQFMSQTEFADFIYDNQADVSGMPGADLLEVVQQLKATAQGTYRDMRDRTGSIDLIYKVEVKTTNAFTEKDINFPTETEISVPLYEGGGIITLKVDFKIKTPAADGGPPLFSYRMYRPDTVILNHHKALSDALKEATGLPVWS